MWFSRRRSIFKEINFCKNYFQQILCKNCLLSAKVVSCQIVSCQLFFYPEKLIHTNFLLVWIQLLLRFQFYKEYLSAFQSYSGWAFGWMLNSWEGVKKFLPIDIALLVGLVGKSFSTFISWLIWLTLGQRLHYFGYVSTFLW